MLVIVRNVIPNCGKLRKNTGFIGNLRSLKAEKQDENGFIEFNPER